MGAKHPKYIVYMYEIVKEFLKTNNNPPPQGSEEVRRTMTGYVGGGRGRRLWCGEGQVTGREEKEEEKQREQICLDSGVVGPDPRVLIHV